MTAEQTSQGKNILWVGRPKQGVLFAKHPMSHGLSNPGSIIAAGIGSAASIVFIEMIWQGNTRLLIAELVLMVLTTTILIRNLVLDKRRREATIYEVTTSHLVVRQRGSVFSDPVVTCPIDAVSQIVRKDFADGTGSLIFFDRSNDRARPTTAPLMVFERIATAKSVEELVRRLQVPDITA